MIDASEVVRCFYACMAASDYNGVIALLSDRVVWKIPGPATIPYAGVFQGKDGVAEFFQILKANEQLKTFTPHEFIVDEAVGIVCVLGSETAAAIATGKEFSTTWAEIFRVRDGLIVEFEEHIDTHTLAEAYGPMP